MSLLQAIASAASLLLLLLCCTTPCRVTFVAGWITIRWSIFCWVALPVFSSSTPMIGWCFRQNQTSHCLTLPWWNSAEQKPPGLFNYPLMNLLRHQHWTMDMLRRVYRPCVLQIFVDTRLIYISLSKLKSVALRISWSCLLSFPLVFLCLLFWFYAPAQKILYSKHRLLKQRKEKRPLLKKQKNSSLSSMAPSLVPGTGTSSLVRHPLINAGWQCLAMRWIRLIPMLTPGVIWSTLMIWRGWWNTSRRFLREKHPCIQSNTGCATNRENGSGSLMRGKWWSVTRQVNLSMRRGFISS